MNMSLSSVNILITHSNIKSLIFCFVVHIPFILKKRLTWESSFSIFYSVVSWNWKLIVFKETSSRRWLWLFLMMLTGGIVLIWPTLWHNQEFLVSSCVTHCVQELIVLYTFLTKKMVHAASWILLRVLKFLTAF